MRGGPGYPIKVFPASPRRWNDLELLFGKNGACAGCWCMWWRARGKTWDDARGAANRSALRKLVTSSGPPPGLLAYSGREVVGWVALAPRTDYVRLAYSRTLAAIDERAVWSITCFFVCVGWRGRGVARALLAAAVPFARKHGARALEGYPIDTGGQRRASVWLYTGTLPMFTAAGFEEVARRSPTRPIVRRVFG